MARTDVATEAEHFIMLGESALTRTIQAVDTDTPQTGVVDSREIDISAHQVMRPRALFLKRAESNREIALTPQTDGTFPYAETSGEPKIWSCDGDEIKFERPLDQAYTFRFE